MKKENKFKKAILSFLYRGRYFYKKLFFVLITLVLTTIMIFFILRLTPGDTVYNYAKTIQASQNLTYEEAYRVAVNLLNYDPQAPIYEQFFRFVKGLFDGTLGQSIYNKEITAALLIKQKLPWTLFISTLALMISFFLGTWIGSIMARRRGKVTDNVISGFVILSNSIPDFLIGLLLMMLFSYKLGWFPMQGNYDIQYHPGFNFPFIWNVIWHAILPIMSIVLGSVGGWIFQMRANATSVLGEDYIYCAKVRGVSEKLITNRYLKRNSLLPLITTLALAFAALFGGSTLMESIFNYPGLGQELASRIALRDYFVVQGILFFSSSVVILLNFFVDMIYYLIDPRVRRDN